MKKYDRAEADAARKEKVDAALKKLDEGVRIFQDSDEFKAYLKTMAKFHNYSVNNSILIYLQKPDATYCAGFTTWKSMGRYVKAGEKGISILAPAFKKKEVDVKNQDGTPILDADGNPKKEEKIIPRYKVTTTFDYSQTEGKELPEILSELKGEVPDYENLFGALKNVAEEKGVSVGFEDIPSGAKGYYSLSDNRIAIKNGMSEMQNLKTLAHEITHSRLDNLDRKEEAGLKTDRYGKETRAEATAFVVCSHFGIDTSDYSFAYLNTWTKDREFKDLTGQMENIRTEANAIITEAEAYLGRMPEQKEIKEQITRAVPRRRAAARGR
jgi:antirestriction protein ArdC